ncbi:hypothetical protein QQS21_001441 [Conoideocrella luteorostrata]|uniref:Nephrocystin 3-like N-terminal domain-containing protein n=1 Tax=Conoideocrella luteorostrata TaxID=1105319 RepID=A0AAJ0CZZ1_9HYPO|nr:hypothetical protein QQS21_001441 [Conoideocrella luteorostrata]
MASTLDAAVCTIGWIAPMALELSPAIAILERRTTMIVPEDDTFYHVGRVGDHWVVMTVCPKIGTHPATTVLINMRRSFPNIKHILLVGIAGGIPSYGPGLEEQIVLGDVVVSYPQRGTGGLVHHGFEKAVLAEGGQSLPPSSTLLKAVNTLRANHMLQPGTKIPHFLRELRLNLKPEEQLEYQDPGAEHDILFLDGYFHSDRQHLCKGVCDFSQSTQRSHRGAKAKRERDTPRIHYGIVGCANTLVISSALRNALYTEHRVICFEMESAGVMIDSQALIVRGICDYADSHKNKTWQKYAAAVAAAYAKEVLLLVPPVMQDKRGSPIPGFVPQFSQDTLDCLKSLAFRQMDSRYLEISSSAIGTCKWLLTHDTYKQWVTSQRGILWIKGKPGSGKSTLLKYAVRSHELRHDDIILSFFFHGRGSELQKCPAGFFRSLLRQLLKQAPSSLSALVYSFKERCEEIGELGEDWQWHNEELWQYFESFLGTVLETRSVWLFVDALDECGEEHAVTLVEWFKALLQSALSTNLNLHVCFTCRHYPITSLGFKFEICLEHENGQDISTYVQARFSASPEIHASTILDSITGHANGVFMWSRLVVDRVLALDRRGEGIDAIKMKIRSIPPDLDNLYNDLIQNMDSASLDLIQWICVATRPLTLDELQWIMLTRNNSTYRSLRSLQKTADHSRLERQIWTLSRGLAEVVPTSQTQVVQFIHDSVQDFFLNKGLSRVDSGVSSPRVAVGKAHLHLARICTRYLAMDEFDGSTTYNVIKFPLLQYAVSSWIVHIKQCDMNGSARSDLLELLSLASNDLVKRWARIYQAIEGHSNDCPPEGSTLVHILSRYGILGPLELLLRGGVGSVDRDFDSKDGRGRTPLIWAAENGHYAVVELLLATEKVDINFKDSLGQTPLSRAAENGHFAVIKLLLTTNRADINSRDRFGFTPLSWAAENGHYEAVKLMTTTNKLEFTSADDFSNYKPLLCAVENKHERIIELLLDTYDVHVNAKDITGQTILSWAAEHGYSAVVKLLLATPNVDVNSADSFGNTALSWAAENGHDDIVRQLLATGKVDINLEDTASRTPLSRAAENGHIATIKLILETGKADIHTKDKFGDTPLQWAENNGHDSVVLLLESKANL